MAKIRFYFKKIKNTQPYKLYLEGKIKKIEKFLKENDVLNVEFSLIDKKTFYTEFNFQREGKLLRATSKSFNPFESIDKAIDKLVKRIKKEKNKK